jgi:prevent-host-death family protein
MQTLNIRDAKAHFSKLIEAVSQGERVIIARAGKPVAALVSIDVQPQVRKPGALKGKLRIAEDFDMSLSENIAASFKGN